MGIAKTASRSLSLLPTNTWSKQEATSIICASRNVTPLCNSQLSPLSSITGRNDLTDRIVHSVATNAFNNDADAKNPWPRLKAIYDTRALLLKLDSRNLWKLAASNSLRIGFAANYQYVHDQDASVWMPHLKKGHGCFRVLNDSDRGAVVVERRHRLLEIPLQRNRPVLCPENDQNFPKPQISIHPGSVVNRIDLFHDEKGTGPSSPSTDNANQKASQIKPQAPTQVSKRYFIRSNSRTLSAKMHLDGVSRISTMHPDELYTDNVTTMETMVKAPNKVLATVSEINPSALYDEYGPFGISRIPPRVFLQIPEARQEVRDEAHGLLQEDTK